MKKKKNYLRKFLSCVIICMLMCLMFPVSADAASVKLNKKNIKVSIGKTYTLKSKGQRQK